MKNQDVLKKETGIVGKYGVKNLDGRIVVPIEYDFVEQVNDNLYVATKGSINGLRYTHGRILCTTEQGGTYGVVFNKMVENKTLDTEVEFYTKQGRKLYLGSKFLAAVVCKNNDMLLVLEENYKWSMILIDYQNQFVLSEAYTHVDSIEMDYESNRFIVEINKEYVIVSFKDDNTIAETTPLLLCKPVKLCEKGAIVKQENKYGFMSYSGKVILSCIYDDMKLEDTFIRTINNGHIELFLYTGEYIIGGEYYVWWKPFTVKGVRLTMFSRKDGTNCIWSSKKQILECEYTSIEVCDEFAIACNLDGKYGMFKYDEEKDEMKAVLPTTFPVGGFERMKFIYKDDKAYVIADEKFIINLKTFEV